MREMQDYLKNGARNKPINYDDVREAHEAAQELRKSSNQKEGQYNHQKSSTFEFMHAKRRNRLEHERLNNLVYVKYNKKMTESFQKMCVEGSKFNLLIFDEYEWNTDWIDAGAEDVHEAGLKNLECALIDEVVVASNALMVAI